MNCESSIVPWETRGSADRDVMVNSTSVLDQCKNLLAKKNEFAPRLRSECLLSGAVTSCQCTTRCCPRTFRSRPLIQVRRVDMDYGQHAHELLRWHGPKG